MNRDYSKCQKDLKDEKPLVVRVAKGSNLFDRGDIFLATTESAKKLY